MVYPLEDIATARAITIEAQAVRVVNVTAAVRLRGKELAAQFEMARDGAQVMFCIRRFHRLSERVLFGIQ